MYKLIIKSLIEWNETSSDRVKLQNAYVVSAIVLIVLAGLVGLVNYGLGQQMTTIALIALGVFIVNLIAWTLLQGLVLMRLSAASSKKSATKPTKKS